MKRLLCRIFGHKWEVVGITDVHGDIISQCKRCGAYKLNDIENP